MTGYAQYVRRIAKDFIYNYFLSIPTNFLSQIGLFYIINGCNSGLPTDKFYSFDFFVVFCTVILLIWSTHIKLAIFLFTIRFFGSVSSFCRLTCFFSIILSFFPSNLIVILFFFFNTLLILSNISNFLIGFTLFWQLF